MCYIFVSFSGDIKKGWLIMPRNARYNTLSESKIYHVIIKGINEQEIFLEDSDRIKFLALLKHSKNHYTYDIYAYALMNNHIHLIIYDTKNELSKIIHRICCVYAMYFNQKYQRKGHLFQNRFKSKCVDTESYLLNLQRYIHRNPQKDGIELLDKYKWSSYREYLTKADVVSTKFVLDIFDENRNKAITKFIQYNKMFDTEYGIQDFEIRKNLSDEEAIEKIKKVLRVENIMLIQKFRGETRDKYIKNIFKIKGISKKQISRITGISVRTIHRAITGK